ncbi:DgyrCDS5561 [Dimorphilus gyrociliatus]|uniref:DgyrCDS5561 n=1 Tax=Dimorphilus gyrociliatus TaxID=2664684 RepID=A0A7I8VLV1_9ANNE|nr:DgyrCDS5561 [Dimorphilus gyrociliatus]
MSDKLVKLRRHYGVLHGIGCVCGLMFGAGVYIAPTGVLRQVRSGPLSIVIWGCAGLFSFVASLIYAELGTTYPVSGEKYAYLLKMYGRKIAFLYLWTYLFLFRSCVNAVKCIAFAKYILEPIFGCDNMPPYADFILALLFGWVPVIANCFYVKWAARGQTIMTFMGIAAMLSIIVTAIYKVASTGDFGDLSTGFSTGNYDIESLCFGFYSALWALWGFPLNFMIDELKKPERNLPIIATCSMIITIVLYSLVNFAYVVVLGAETVANNVAVASLFAKKIWGPGWILINLCISSNIASSFNSGIVIGSRLTHASAKRKDLADALGLVSIKYLTPITAIIFQGILTTLMMLLKDIFVIINLSVFTNQMFEILVIIGLIINRFKKPDIPRPFKVPIILIICFAITMIGQALLSGWKKPLQTVLGFVITVSTGFTYYILFIYIEKKPKFYIDMRRKITILLQKTFYASEEDLVP